MPQLYLVVQGRAQLEHSNDIVKVGVKATCKHFKPWHILKETIKPADPFETIPQEPRHPGKGAKLDCVIQLNCREVHIDASYKTTRTRDNFNHRGTKMNELWSIANNSKSFANRSKSIIRNNLGLYKLSDIYLI